MQTAIVYYSCSLKWSGDLSGDKNSWCNTPWEKAFLQSQIIKLHLKGLH